VAGLFTFLMLAFAGIPLTSGFTSKFAVFQAALGVGAGWQVAMVIAGVVTSMILAFPYLRVVVLMWLSEPADQSPTVSIPGAFTSAALMVGVLATFVLGVFPSPILDLADKAAEFIR
jgi:NADH-quinone oxidoreductase subunit N